MLRKAIDNFGVAAVIAVIVALVVLIPSGDEKVVDAICTQWDPEHPAHLSDLMDQYDYESSPDEIIDEAKRKCPGSWKAYDDWLAAVDPERDDELDVDPTPSIAPVPDPRDLTFQDELEFAAQEHSCEELRAWYEANPGDSNYDIALQYYDKCDEIPPPVLSGEIGSDDFQ